MLREDLGGENKFERTVINGTGLAAQLSSLAWRAIEKTFLEANINYHFRPILPRIIMDATP